VLIDDCRSPKLRQYQPRCSCQLDCRPQWNPGAGTHTHTEFHKIMLSHIWRSRVRGEEYSESSLPRIPFKPSCCTFVISTYNQSFFPPGVFHRSKNHGQKIFSKGARLLKLAKEELVKVNVKIEEIQHFGEVKVFTNHGTASYPVL
jgi:hypothetical protein